MYTPHIRAFSITEFRRQTSAEAVPAICDVLSGLEEAHALGIVHRGITAEHVMITPDGVVKLGGFGLAKPVSDIKLTQAGAVLGDAKYISPEQVMGVGALDARSDVYSVGVLLFQALTGRVPFDAANDFDVMVAHVSAQPPRPSSLNPGIAPELEQVVLTALAKKPEDRFASANEFRKALTSPIRVMPPEAPAVQAIPEAIAPGFTRVATRRTPRTALVLGSLGIAIVLLVLFFVTMHSV